MLIAAGYIVNKTRSTPKINEPRLGDDVLGGWGGGHVCQWGGRKVYIKEEQGGIASAFNNCFVKPYLSAILSAMQMYSRKHLLSMKLY